MCYIAASLAIAPCEILLAILPGQSTKYRMSGSERLPPLRGSSPVAMGQFRQHELAKE